MFNHVVPSILFVSFTLATAQSIAVKRITINDGLSQNYIFSSLQDSKGFLWFGTKDGLNRYDGYTFKIYRKDNADPQSLSDNNVTAIEEGDGHLLWIGTANGGLLRFDRLTERFHRYVHDPGTANSVTSDRISVIKKYGGKLLIGTLDGGLNIFSPEDGTWKVFRHDPLDKASLCSDLVNDVKEDLRGNIWVSGAGISVIDPSGSVRRIVIDTLDNFFRRTGTLYRDRKGRMWICDRFGLVMFDGIRYHLVFRATDQNQLYWPGVIREDSKGDMWITNAHSLLWVDGKALRVEVKSYFPEERLSSSMVIDRSDIIWMGTGGWGIIGYNPRTDKFGRREGNLLQELLVREFSIDKKFINNETFNFGLRGNDFRCPFRDRDGNIFIPTSNGYVFRIDTKGKMTRHDIVPDQDSYRTTYNPYLIFQDKQGTIWINRNDGIVRFTGKTHLTEFVKLYPVTSPAVSQIGYSNITTVYADDDGTIWFGTPLLGLLEYHPETGERSWYSYRDRDTTSISHNHVLSIIPDPIEPERFLWVGTEGGGLNKFNKLKKTFISITERQGFPNNTVYGILADDEKMLWISTNKGLVKFDPRDHSMRLFDVYDGLQSNEFNRKEFYKGSDGRMYFGGVNGYNVFTPSDIAVNMNPPDVVLTDVRLFNRPISFKSDTAVLKQAVEFTNAITLKYTDNVITFEFAALEYSAPEKNQYQYKLDGFHDHWIRNGTSRTATFTNIDPGEYVLRVRASNGDGVWNTKEATLTITVLPPFWLTWWFQGAIVLIFISVGPSIYYLRVNQLKRQRIRQEEVSQMLVRNQEEERKRIAQEMHDVLGQELLVIKNRAIMGLKSIADDSKEKKQLIQISESASSILKKVREISHNLRPPELDRLGLTETLRAIVTNVSESSSFSVTGIIDTIDGLIDKENEINLVRIIQEALSNVVKYADAKEVTIEVNRTGEGITIRVKDDGIGFDKGTIAPGMGLAGISERVRILNGTASIHSEPGKGTVISIHIALNGKSQQLS